MFETMMGEIFERRGVPAVYVEPGDDGDELACTAIRQGGGEAVMVGPVRVIVDRTLFHVRRAELAAPVAGGELELMGESWTVEAVQPCEKDPDQLKWQLECSWGIALGYRSVSGEGTTQNPPIATAPKVHANTLAGAAAIGISSASLLVGKVVAGDVFTIAGDATVYTVTGPVTAAASVLAAVPITPVLAANADAGDAVTFDFLRDYSVRAAVSAYLAEELAAGVQVGDRRLVILQAAIAAAGMTGEPKAGDKVTIGSRAVTVLKATAIYRGDAAYAWDVQCRG